MIPAFVFINTACENELSINYRITGQPENMDIVYLRSGTYLGISYDNYKFILKSEIDKNEYIENIKTEVEKKLEWEFTGGPGLVSALNEYDKNFFVENNLIMILLNEGSSAIRNSVESSNVKNNEITIKIKRYDPGDRGYFVTTDMAYWYIIIPIRKDYFNGDDINVKIVKFK